MTKSAFSRPIVVDGVNITDHVAAMFDAIVGSADWGSGFLDTETIASILTVAELAGLDTDGLKIEFDPPGFGPYPPATGKTRPAGTYPTPDELAEYDARRAEWLKKRSDAMAAWRAQVKAMALAQLSEVARAIRNLDAGDRWRAAGCPPGEIK